MKIGFKLSVAIAAAALTLGIGSASAQSRCTPCYTAYEACLAAGNGERLLPGVCPLPAEQRLHHPVSHALP